MSHHKEHERNRNAHGRVHRKGIGQGDEDVNKTPSQGDDDMGTTILGDVTNPTPVVIAGGKSEGSMLKTLAVLAAGGLMGASGLGAGAGAMYLFNKLGAQEQVAQPTEPAPRQKKIIKQESNDVQFGLGKLEDYIERGLKLEK